MNVKSCLFKIEDKTEKGGRASDKFIADNIDETLNLSDLKRLLTLNHVAEEYPLKVRVQKVLECYYRHSNESGNQDND